MENDELLHKTLTESEDYENLRLDSIKMLETKKEKIWSDIILYNSPFIKKKQPINIDKCKLRRPIINGKLLDDSEGVDEIKSINYEKSEETLQAQINEYNRQISDLDNFKENHKPIENKKIDLNKLLESEKKEFLFWKENYLKQTKDDGNCLFSATYRCLRDRKMGDCMIKLFGENIRNEEKSIQNLREVVSNYGENHIRTFLEGRRQLIEDNKDEETPDLEKYFNDLYAGTSLENTTTIEEIQNNIRKDRKWASFLEYDIITDLLKKVCGINLIMLSSNNQYNIHRIIVDPKGDRIEKYDINNPSNIYLYNDDDKHYLYFHNDDKFSIPLNKDGNKKPKSLKKSRRRKFIKKPKSLKKSRRRRSIKKAKSLKKF